MSIVAMSSTSVVNIDDGNGVVSVEVTYAVGTSPTTPPGNPMVDGGNVIVDINGVPMTNASWQTGIPTVPQGSYLWTRTVTTYTSGDFAISYAVGYTGSDGSDGPRGISITDEKEQWYLSNSNSSLTGGSWSDTEPSEIPDGKYLWGRWAFTMSDGSTQYSDAVYRSVIGGVVNLTDEINKKISQKIWSTDIETSVQQYDASVTQTIRDRMSDVEQDLNGITSRVSAAESSLTTKADGSTVTALQNTVTQNKQTADAFQQTVTSTYAKLTDVADQIGSIKIGGNNLYVIADEVPGYLHSNNTGSIATQSSTYKEITSDYIPVKAGSNYIIQSWCTPSATGESWLAYQFFSDNDPVTPAGNRIAKYGRDSNSGVETTAEGQERLMYDVQAPEGATLLRVSYRSFNDGYAMVECATKPSEYSINSRDIEQYTDDAVESAKSEIKQTTDSISLEVSKKVGSSEIISKINQSPETVTISASKIDLIGNVTFNMFDSDTQNALTSGSELIIGSQTAQTSAWTGKSTKLSAIGSGTRISYKLPYASTSTAVTLNLTLNNNTTTGAKEVYYLNNTRLNTQYGVNSIVELIYDGSAWRVINPYSDANTYDRTRYQQAIKAGATAITSGNIIVAGANNVGTYTHLKLGNAFDTTYPILYAGSNIAANSTGNNNYLIIPLGITTTQTGTYTAYKSVYIKGTLSGTTFTPVSTTPLTQTIPTSADNYHYMLLGTMYSATEMYLLGDHPIFQYYKNAFMTTTQIAAEAATTAETANSTANTANTNASNAVSTANTANTNASNAVSTANTANTNASNAVSTANTANTNASNAVSTANTANTNASNAVSTANTAKSTADTAKSTADTATDMASKTLGMKVNYSAFNTVDNGEVYLHGYTNNAPADVNGYVYWNGVKRNVSKGMINPNGILPYYKTILIVLRLSSAAATSGTLYLVWYNGGWKHSATSPSAVAGDWSWAENTDIVLGQFIEPSNEGAIVDAYLYEPPRNASHVLTTGLNSYGYSENAVTWVSNNGTNMTNALSMIKKWTNNAVSDTTTIQGGWIATNTITSQQLATNAIVSNNYIASTNLASPYSATGTFLDLSNGNFWTPNFGVINTTPDGSSVPVGAWFNGTVYASAGKFGTDTSYWNIETVYDYNNQPHASLVGVGDPYLQTGNWQVSNNAVATRKYTSTNETSGTATYYKDTNSNTFYDVGMKIPTNFGAYSNSDSSVVKYNKAFFYGRKYTGNNVPALDADWTYFFMIDASGNIFENGTKLSDKYASIDGVSGAYLPLTGGTISGNLTVSGTLTATASAASKLATSRNLNVNLSNTSNGGIVAFDGSSAVTLGVTGTLGVGNGGTGATTFTSGAVLIGNGTGAIQTRGIRNNTTIGNLGWTASGTDNTLATTNTIAYWNGRYNASASNLEYVKLGKLGTVVTHNIEEFITTAGGTVDELTATDLSAGNLTVTGGATFTNGLTGNLIGDVTGNVVGNVSGTSSGVTDSNNGTKTTFAYSKSGLAANWNSSPWFAAWNGYELRAISPANLKTTIGLGNVDNTADANKNVLTATKFASAQSVTLTGDTTGTASSQAGWSIATKTDRISTIGDKRNVATTPNDYSNKIIFQGLKAKATVDNPSNDQYSYIIGLRGWSDSSGGKSHELAFNNAGIYRRVGGTTTWENWYAILDSNNYNSYAPALDGTGATGTWGISVSGNATTATTASRVSGTAATANSDRHVWFSDGSTETVRNYDDDFKYNPSTNTLTVANVAGNASTATTAGSLTTGRDFTIGKTKKSAVKWDGAVAFTQAEISDCATNTANGWMSKDDKIKLDSITVSDIGTVGANSIVGATNGGIDVSITSGVATIKHTNQLSSGGTAQGTANNSNLTNGGSFTVPTITYDINGHITATGTNKLNLPNITTITGNAGTATKFASAQSVTLTGDTTGTASSQAGWSIATSNIALSCINNSGAAQVSTSNRPTTANTSYHDGKMRYYLATSSMSANTGKPSGDGGILHLAWDNTGYDSQIAIIGNSGSPGMEIRSSNGGGTWGDWIKVITSLNYNTYAPKLDGTGATGTWGISISGASASATNDSSGNNIVDTYVKKSGDTITGTLILSRTTDLSGTANNKPALIVGGTDTQAHIEIDSNEIQAKATGTTTAALYINNDGGTIYLGPNITANGTTVTATTFSGTATKANSLATESGTSVGARPVWFSYLGDNTKAVYNTAFTYNPSGGILKATTFDGNATSATKATQDGDGNTISSTYAKLSGATFTGAVSGTSFSASSYMSVNSGNSGTTGGLSLYGNNPTAYGIAMRSTGNGGKHGYVQGDWATYFYMQGSNGTANDTYLTRGWIFKNNGYGEGVASISGHGNAVFRGSVTIGGNTTNTSGMRMEYDANLNCTNFVFY